mmetsp:Transcript_33516/g.75773  ORF Transcript_33516/g.75773 Transcript_33516/m.75773 type:complete len:268 (-) Transcript_33516:718-1521(-)
MACVAFGVDQDEPRKKLIAERVSKGANLVGGAGGGGRGVGAGLVAQVHSPGGHLARGQPVPRLEVPQKAPELGADVPPVQRRAVVGAVAVLGAYQHTLGDRAAAAAAQRPWRPWRPEAWGGAAAGLQGLWGLKDQADSARAEEHAVACLAKGEGRVSHSGGHRGRPEGPEAVAEPGQEVGRGGVVSGHHHHPLAPSAAEKVLGHGHGLGGARARRVGLGVGAAGTDHLGQLRVAKAKHLEEELSVELVGLGVGVLNRRSPGGALEQL